MQTGASANADRGTYVYASGVVDPEFTVISPGYSLNLPPGVGNSVLAIPEPSGWILMIFGVALTGVGLRTRRAVQGAVSAR